MGFLIKLATRCAFYVFLKLAFLPFFSNRTIQVWDFGSFDSFAKYQLIIQDELHKKICLYSV